MCFFTWLAARGAVPRELEEKDDYLYQLVLHVQILEKTSITLRSLVTWLSASGSGSKLVWDVLGTVKEALQVGMLFC